MAFHFGKGRGPGHLNRTPQGNGVVATLVAVNAGVFGNKTPASAGFGQVDLAAAYRAAGSDIPSGTQTWDVQIVSGTNASTALGYNDASSLTASGYSGTGNTGRTPYRKGALSGAYVLQYRVKINGGTYSNWANYSFTAEADSVSCGNNYSSDNFPFGILGVADGATAYTNGVRKMRLMVGLSRPDFRMGSGFTFSSGTGWSSSDMMKVMWANNQLPPTLSAISFGGSGIWIDLEYDGVTVTGGRLVGVNNNVLAKIQISGDDNRVTRCNLMNTEADFLTEHVGSVVNVWGGIRTSGNRNEIGYAPGGATDYSYANYVSHVFYGINVLGGADNKEFANVIWNCHGRSVARYLDTTGTVAKYNLCGPIWRTRLPTVDTSNHLDSLWSNDTDNTTVEQTPTLENNLILNVYGAGAYATSGRLIVFGSTKLTSLAIDSPKARGNLIIAPYNYGIELPRPTGNADISYNTLITAISGDFSGDLEEPNHGGNSMELLCTPSGSDPGLTSFVCDKNVIWNKETITGYPTSVRTGTNVQLGKSAGANWINGGDPKAIIEAEPASRWAMPTKASEVATLMSFLFANCAYPTGSNGAVNDAGTAWRALP